jgi:hypothetical protein
VLNRNLRISKRACKILFKKSAYRRLYSPPVNFYRTKRVHHINKKRAHSLAQEIIHVINGMQNRKITVIFSDEDTPPLIGDFLVVVLFIKYLSLLEVKIDFYIIRKRGNGKIWDRTTQLELDEYYRQQQLITKDQLSLDAKTIYTKRLKSDLETLVADGSDLLINLPRLESICPYVVFLLIKHFNNSLPDDFLLFDKNQSDFAPYITWGLRLSKWQKYRNSSNKSISRDFNALLKSFPNKNIVLLSNKAGLKQAFEVLFGLAEPVEIVHNGVRILPQPQDGFFEGAGYLLGSEFYFQRSGGGMFVPAVFSKIPYLCFQEHQNNFYGRKLLKAFSWSSKNQLTVVTTKLFTKLLPVRIFLRIFDY